MKKYLYIFCTLTGAALMGCTDLDLIPEDTMAPENYFCLLYTSDAADE